MDLSILDKVLFGPITVRYVIFGMVVLFIVLVVVPKIFSKKERADVYETVRCYECGWTGEVSKYHKVCRKCNSDSMEKIG